MDSTKNNVSLDFRSYTEQNHDTDISVNMNADNVDDKRLMRMLNTWLRSIESSLVVKDGKGT